MSPSFGNWHLVNHAILKYACMTFWWYENKLRATVYFSSVQFSSVQFSRSVVSDSLQPHGLQHARLPCPSPTPGVYSNSCPLSWWCHSLFLKQYIYSCPKNNHISCLHAQQCTTFYDPIDCSPPGSSVHGIFQARLLEWVAISFSREPSQPRDQTYVPASPALKGRFLTSEPPGKPQKMWLQ